MRSKAHIKGHPLHPILIAFPVAFLVAALADGVPACKTVSCPWHGSQFDVRTGAVQSGPAERPISTYEVREVTGEVRLALP
jgi:nitrite reductase/ring-hydroxylating ferredoxin subunit